MTELFQSLLYMSGNLVMVSLVIVPVLFLLGICVLYLIGEALHSFRNRRGVF